MKFLPFPYSSIVVFYRQQSAYPCRQDLRIFLKIWGIYGRISWRMVFPIKSVEHEVVQESHGFHKLDGVEVQKLGTWHSSENSQRHLELIFLAKANIAKEILSTTVYRNWELGTVLRILKDILNLSSWPRRTSQRKFFRQPFLFIFQSIRLKAIIPIPKYSIS